MSNNNRSNTRNTGNTTPQNRNTQPAAIPTQVWVVRPSFTVGYCRVYASKEAAFKDFGRAESLWTLFHDYDIDQNLQGEVWTIEKSPVWDAEYDVQWQLEQLDIRGAIVAPKAASTPAPVKITTEKAETSSVTTVEKPDEVKVSTP